MVMNLLKKMKKKVVKAEEALKDAVTEIGRAHV